MKHFKGRGAGQIYQFDERAQLLEYLDGIQLKNIRNDEQATSLFCDVFQRLHGFVNSENESIPIGSISLKKNYESLFLKSSQEPPKSLFRKGAEVAEHLLNTERNRQVLHGDLHHENILFSSKRGWLAIDPKAIYGEKTYDVAAAFYNPTERCTFIERTETIQQRRQIFSNLLGLDSKRILEFAFTYGCLSAAWKIEDHQDPHEALRIAAQIQYILGV